MMGKLLFMVVRRLHGAAMVRMILVSRRDEVSMAVGRRLIESFGFREEGEGLYMREGILLYIIDRSHLEADSVGEGLGAELVVVASVHRSEAGVKALLTHPTGNWGEEAEYGGRPHTLSATSAKALYTALHALKEEADRLGLKDWRVGMEATHHGPRTDAPLIYVEAGGRPGEKPDEKAVEAVAAACLAAAEGGVETPEAVVGFGGTHYAPTFTRLALRGDYAVGHICPKYAMPVDPKMVRQAFEKTVERPRKALIDWKGVPSEPKHRLVETLNQLGIPWEKV